MDFADPPYPRPIGPWWFGCPEGLRRRRQAGSSPLGEDLRLGDLMMKTVYVDENGEALSDQEVMTALKARAFMQHANWGVVTVLALLIFLIKYIDTFF